MSAYEAINIVLVGDPKVGKTTLISSCHEQNPVLGEGGFATKPFEFPTVYKPTSFKSHRTDVRLCKSYFRITPIPTYGAFQANIIDTGGLAKYDYIRPLAYMNCEVFMLCFDITNSVSLENVQSKWLPEIRYYQPQVPVILLGTKVDLKTERQVVGKEAYKLSNILGLDKYVEVSCFDDFNVMQLFTTAVELAKRRREKNASGTNHEEAGSEIDINELESPSDPPAEYPKKGSSTLQEDWQATWNHSTLTDVVVKFPDQSPDVHAHKCILALASGAFKKLLKTLESNKSTFVGNSLQQTKIEGTSTNQGTTNTYEKSKGQRNWGPFLNGVPFSQVQCEQELSKNPSKRGTVVSSEDSTQKLQISLKGAIDYAAFSCILKWMYTGLLDIPEKIDDDFIRHLYQAVIELEVYSLEVISYRLLRHKRNVRINKSKQNNAVKATLSNGNEAPQVGDNLSSLLQLATSAFGQGALLNAGTDGAATPLNLFEIFAKEEQSASVPEAPSLETFERYINWKQQSCTTTATSHCPSDKTKAEVAKNEAISAYREMWRTADGLFIKDNFMADTVLMVEDTPIPVHRVVMVTRSPVLAAMLNGNFKEKDDSEIRLPGISLEHFHAVLDFVYTDKCLLNKANHAHGLMELANRFGIQSLMDRCEEFLLYTHVDECNSDVATMSAQQVGVILESAQLSRVYNALFLYEWCLHFVAVNYFYFERKKGFQRFCNENKEYLEKNRWPPRKFLQVVDAYKRKARRRQFIRNIRRILRISSS